MSRPKVYELMKKSYCISVTAYTKNEVVLFKLKGFEIFLTLNVIVEPTSNSVYSVLLGVSNTYNDPACTEQEST